MTEDGEDDPKLVEISAVETDELLAEAIDSAELIASRPSRDAGLVEAPNYEEMDRTELLVQLASRHTILQRELRKLCRRRRD
jgi:hypothetical protein